MSSLLSKEGRSDFREISGQSGSGSPVGTKVPKFVDQLYHDLDADIYWRSTGLTNQDWIIISGGSSSIIVTNPIGLESYFGLFSHNQISELTEIVIIGPDIGDGFDVSGTNTITSVIALDLVLIDNNKIFSISSTSLSNLSLPILASIDSSNGFNVTNSGALVSINLPALANIGLTIPSTFNIYGNTILTTIFLGNVVFGNNCFVGIVNCALSQTSVDHILARCVASEAFVSGTVDLSGGTNSPPTSVAEGSDYAILTGRGVIVTVNSPP